MLGSAILLFLFFFNSLPISSSPDHFLKSLPPRNIQEYFELSPPLPSDHLTPSCTLTIVHHAFAHTINSPPFSAPYSPPSDCPSPWSRVFLEFRAASAGEQYDRIAGLWLGGVELLRTSTAEPNDLGIFWKVRKDVTKYSSVFSKSGINVTMMLENIVNEVFTGIYHVRVSLLFYQDKVDPVRVPSIIHGSDSGKIGLGHYESPADMVIPIGDDGERGFWFRVESESDIHVKRIRIPRNTMRLVLELYVSYHGDDEFWYSNPPYSYIRTNNLTTGRGNGAYREVFVTIDGRFAGSELVLPVIFTGGINPLFWEPVVAIGAFNLPTYDLDLTPFLGLLLDGKSHDFSIAVDDGISYWLVDANLHVWLAPNSTKIEAKSVVYNSPALSIEREEAFQLLDGSFKIKARRKSQFVGWVKSSSGNFTTIVTQQFKFSNFIKFDKNGTSKVVKQSIKAKRNTRIKGEMGNSMTHVVSRKRYPLNVITSTLPGLKNDTYLLVTNVSHGIIERYTNGAFSGSVYNSQVSGGWMEVKDHSVVSGEANTRQKSKYEDAFGCFCRNVVARNGKLVSDNSTYSCPSSS